MQEDIIFVLKYKYKLDNGKESEGEFIPSEDDIKYLNQRLRTKDNLEKTSEDLFIEFFNSPTEDIFLELIGEKERICQ